MMMRIGIKLIAGCFLALTLVLSPQISVAGELQLVPELVNKLNSLLSAVDGLRKAMISENEEQIEIALRDVNLQLDQARDSCKLAKPHECGHLKKMLLSAIESFGQAQSDFESRPLLFESGINQMVNIVRVYRLDPGFSIFFCPENGTSWIQSGKKPQSPFRGYHQRESCGIRVAK